MAPRQRPHGGRRHQGEATFMEGAAGGGGGISDSSSSNNSTAAGGGYVGDNDGDGDGGKQVSSSSSPPPPPPTLNQTESDIARDRHDYFNLVALVRSGLSSPSSEFQRSKRKSADERASEPPFELYRWSLLFLSVLFRIFQADRTRRRVFASPCRCDLFLVEPSVSHAFPSL